MREPPPSRGAGDGGCQGGGGVGGCFDVLGGPGRYLLLLRIGRRAPAARQELAPHQARGSLQAFQPHHPGLFPGWQRGVVVVRGVGVRVHVQGRGSGMPLVGSVAAGPGAAEEAEVREGGAAPAGEPRVSRHERWRTIDASGAPEEGAAVAERWEGSRLTSGGGWVRSSRTTCVLLRHCYTGASRAQVVIQT